MNTHRNKEKIALLTHAERMLRLAREELADVDSGRLASVTYSEDDVNQYVKGAIQILKEAGYEH